jgi:hypothetical protein
MARGEVTGKKPRAALAKAPKAPGWARGPPPTFAAAFTVEEFCRAHRIGSATYYELKKSEQGPDEMEVGRRRIISFEAAARWRREREKAAAACDTQSCVAAE